MFRHSLRLNIHDLRLFLLLVILIVHFKVEDMFLTYFSQVFQGLSMIHIFADQYGS